MDDNKSVEDKVLSELARLMFIAETLGSTLKGSRTERWMLLKLENNLKELDSLGIGAGDCWEFLSLAGLLFSVPEDIRTRKVVVPMKLP